jgi:hypothetical protein
VEEEETKGKKKDKKDKKKDTEREAKGGETDGEEAVEKVEVCLLALYWAVDNSYCLYTGFHALCLYFVALFWHHRLLLLYADS